MKRWLWCVPVVAVLGLAGCGSSSKTGAGTTGTSGATSSTAAPSTTTTTTTVAASTTSTSPSTASPTTATTTGASGTAAICTTAQLSPTLINPNGTAGSIVYDLALTNTSSSPCVIEGYPGVSFVAGSDDHQVGAAARRNAVIPVTPVTLAAGQSAWAPLQVTIAGNYPKSSCDPTPVSGLRIYPPGEKDSLVLSHSDTACATAADNVLSVEAFAAAGATP